MTYRLATLEEDAWELESAVARHRAHPDTFWIPPAEERERLPAGALAKLIFKIETQDESGAVEETTERMWVSVSGRVGRFYVGRLQNQAACTDGFGPGTEVVFTAEHVIDIVPSPPPDWEPA